MSTRRAFETLHGFSDCLKQCRVSTRGNTILLEEGLSVAKKHIEKVQQEGKKVVLVGNGGSAAIASHMSVDLWKNGGIRSIAFNDASLLTCLSNDLGYDHVFELSVKMFCDPGDLLIAISSSGKSQNILNAVAAARTKNMPVISFSGFDTDNPLSAIGDLNFYIDSYRYGTVEVAHLLMIHAVIDEVIEARKDKPKPKSTTVEAQL